MEASLEVIVKTYTLQEFLALPSDDAACELIEGQAIPKMSPKLFHSAVQKALLALVESWSLGRGRVYPEWAVILQRNDRDWVPVPDLIFVSYARLPQDWMLDEACPVRPELVIEIISPGQTFGKMTAKATDYLKAGILRVWIVDTQARSITVFYPDSPPQTYTSERQIAGDEVLDGPILTPEQVFRQAGLPER
ncbi:MAG: Uma2 family endonuclease [Gemmatimonadaceae bacterium]|nr:Uma2 family endonuclease [Gloeobacterales cyanobacterium ES-bin-141]